MSQQSTRHFSSWVKSYCQWAYDDHCPNSFHLWSALSVLSAALERKVWVCPNGNYTLYPNLFVFLVAAPGEGKSSAMNKAVDLLRDLPEERKLNILPSQLTEAKLITEMSRSAEFALRNATKLERHSSGYFFASEASNSLKEIYGDIFSTFTEFYDCPKVWAKGTMKDGNTRLFNVSLSLLAGATPNYLSKIVNEENIMGGFASRVIYVIHDQLIRRKFQWGGAVDAGGDSETRTKLLQDLAQINLLAGPFGTSQGFRDYYEEWFAHNEELRLAEPSEEMKALLSRKHTNLTKLCMLFSAAEADDRILREQHFEQAVHLVDRATQDLRKLLKQNKMQNKENYQGVSTFIVNTITQKEKTADELKKVCLEQGYDVRKAADSLRILLRSGRLRDHEGKVWLPSELESYLTAKRNGEYDQEQAVTSETF